MTSFKNIDKEEAREKVKLLVEKFEAYLELYKGKDYDEAKTRIEFVNPFFEALGWDMDNHEKRMPHDAEVIHEAKQRQNGKTKAPDYLFQAGKGKPFFYVEAKKPSVDLKNDKSPAFQLRKYGWNGSLKISLLTDFEEFAIYNCTKQPRSADTAKVGRLDYFTYKDYLPKFDFFWDTFANHNAYKGSIEAYTKKFSDVNEKESVSVKFLETLENWRTYLATSIALKNKDLDEQGLNYAVQQTIDRVLFLKIAEDRGLEAPNQLLNAAKKGAIYQNIYELFKTADQRYNSGLFDFKKDKIASELIVDNKVIKNIIDDLYNEESFDFALIPVEILGYAYEQFLGKVIVFDPNKVASIELKPEVRKAGGVFYTPQYIVDYIVENTLGKLIKDKTPEEIAKIKVLDPSCGSGSFLLGAYDYLLHYHLDYYVANYQENNKERKKYLTDENKLTTSVKKQILLNNIFGVDIDTQAVEVSKLSLLIKCLEGETQSSMEAQNKLFKEKVLPTLDYNILCGNSLIAPDFYDSGLFLTPQEERKINVFDWKDGFKAVFKQGGFDVVIGNPPYVRADLFANQKNYLETHFQSYEKTADLYVYFLEKTFELLKKEGLYGAIVANKWFKAKYAEKLRGILSQKEIIEIVDFGDLPVFGHVAAYPCILLMKNESNKPDNEDNSSVFFSVTNVSTLIELQLSDYVKENSFLVSKKSLKQDGWSLSNSKKQLVLDKLNQKGIPLSQYINNLAYRGLITGLNEAFVINEETKNRLIKKDKKSKDLIKPFLAGKDLHYYENLKVQRWLIFIPSGWTKIKSNNAENSFEWLQKNYPAIVEYLLPFKAQAEKRYDKGQYWWELRKCAYYEAFEQPKIMYQVLQVKNAFTFDNQGLYCNNSVWFIPKDDKYLLGLLNSKLGWFLISNYCTQIQNGYQLIFEYLSKIPINVIDFENEDEKNAHNQIVKSVATLLDLHEKKALLKSAHEIEQIDRRIKYIENLIDEKLYELYGLTKEEIGIIDES